MNNSSNSIIYKILAPDQFASFQREAVFHGSPADLADGFIHFSSAAQLKATLEKHYARQSGLVILAVDAAALGGAVRWEISRGGARFPHLYAPLTASSVIAQAPLEFTADGGIKLPA